MRDTPRNIELEDEAAPADEILAPGIRSEDPLPRRHPTRPRGVGERLRGMPFLQLFLYYAVLIAVGALLASWFLPVRESLFASPSVMVGETIPAVEQGEAVLTGEAPPTIPGGAESLRELLARVLTTFLVIVGALALVVPVARVYMQTKRLRYDPALVRSVIILPIVVAGIALVVKNSLALAFSLAGIVAAVRFRNTLKDPRDAVYIFLVIGIGLSAGVQALDVALVMSMIFNFVVLGLWRFNIGSIYGGRYGETGVVSSGASALQVAHTPEGRRRIRRSLIDETDDIKAEGVLLVHSQTPELARHTVQEALSETAKDWKLVRIIPREGKLATLEYLIRLKKKSTPTDLVGTLAERWSAQVQAAEYFWFHARERKREEQEDDE